MKTKLKTNWDNGVPFKPESRGHWSWSRPSRSKGVDCTFNVGGAVPVTVTVSQKGFIQGVDCEDVEALKAAAGTGDDIAVLMLIEHEFKALRFRRKQQARSRVAAQQARGLNPLPIMGK